MDRQARATQERRNNRSRYPERAASLYLARLKQRARLGALALGDEHGLLVAGAGPRAELEQLAVWGALCDSEQTSWRQQVDSATRGMPFFSLVIDLGDTGLRLSGLGPMDLDRAEVEQGLRRILGSWQSPDPCERGAS